MDKNLQFYDACSVDGYIYFPALEINGLFKVPQCGGEAKYLGTIYGDSILQKILYRKIIQYDSCLFIIPFLKGEISIYHIDTKEFSLLQTNGIECVGISNALRWREDYVLVPRDLREGFYIFSPKHRRITHKKEIGVQFIRESDVSFSNVCGSCIEDDRFLYIAEMNSNKCIKIDIEHNVADTMTLGLQKLNNIIIDQRILWANSLENNIVLRRDLSTGNEKIYFIDDKKDLSSFVLCNEDIYILPGKGGIMWKYNREVDEWQEFINVYDNKNFKRIYEDYALFVGWHLEDNILVLYPRAGNGILRVNLETRETKVDLVTMNEEDVKRINVELRKEQGIKIGNKFKELPYILEDNKECGLSNFLSYIEFK